MNAEEARKKIEEEGYTNVTFVGEEDGVLMFDCEDEGEEISIFVLNGELIVSPT